ncbi:MAG TPA: RsmE family RNA methyltransferase [Candidatus Didemnitutus sp.]|nr:RsmE family RNA methyltransferase [Candidatus Didemnitutus sp.]
MPDFRAYARSATATIAEIRLDPDESHHLVAVNRCGRGDPVIAFDGRGREWITVCADPNKSAAVLSVKETRLAAPRRHEITLAQALPKGSTMDEIVRQATEIGAARIVPLLSERTQVHLDGDRADKKIEKWRTTAIEAAKQCGNSWLPEIAPVKTLASFLAEAASELKLIASLQAGATSLREALQRQRAKHGAVPTRATWLVGPEGDFSSAEMTAAIMAGYAPVSLGRLVLRCDTAAISALSVLVYELDGLV